MNQLLSFRWNHDLKIISIVFFHVLIAIFGLILAFPQTKALAFWPTTGFALAMVLIYGSRIWPALAIGFLISGALSFQHYGLGLSIESITALVSLMVINTGEALLGFFLITKLFNNSRDPFLNTSHVFIFIFIALALSSLGATLSAFVFIGSQLFSAVGFIDIMLGYFSAKMVGILIITPTILSLKKPFTLHINKMVIAESGLFILALIAVISTLYFENVASTIEKSFPFLVMPFILWLAFRANAQITMLGVLIIATVATYFTTNGSGPFVLENESSSVLLLQIFLGITSIIAFILNTTVWERTQAEKAIKSFNEKLEDNVQKRTKELNEEIVMRKATEEKMKLSNRQLRKANAELDNFVYSVSHDLRAPIASVLGLINLSIKENNIAQIHKYMELIAKSAKQQDSFIKDILDLSRNARLEIAHESIEFNEMISEVFEQFQYYNTEKSVVKEINIQQNNLFHSDKKRLKVILNNLISNAIRYSNGNKPVIKINIDVDDVTAHIRIEDNGKGIAKEHQKNVFKMFYRATDDNAGSGLGLYIVKETVEKLRGAVTIESEENSGTIVCLEIPNYRLN